MTTFSVKMFRALVVPRMKLFENGAWFWLAHVGLYCTLIGSLLHGLYVFSRHFLSRSRKQQLNIFHPQHLNLLCVLIFQVGDNEVFTCFSFTSFCEELSQFEWAINECCLAPVITLDSLSIFFLTFSVNKEAVRKQMQRDTDIDREN